MKTKNSVLILIFILVISSAYSQEKSRKQIKEEQKLEKQKLVEDMLVSKQFVFKAKSAMSAGAGSVNLINSTYNIAFQLDFIKSYLPFYGTGYNGLGPGGDTGFKFKGKPESFTVQKGKKNYIVDAEVKADNDVYRISLSVNPGGNANLSISSNHRSSISFSGEIIATDPQ
ncbi:MAG: DUF4251 domain-containing protein [Bacteroidota bacterium]